MRTRLRGKLIYSTSTKVDIGVDIRQIVNKHLTTYLDDNIQKGDALGPGMTAYSRYDDFKPSKDLVSTWTFDELTFGIHTQNMVTGRPETSIVNIDTVTKDERGRGVVKISSALPFDEHAKLAAAIAESCKKATEATS